MHSFFARTKVCFAHSRAPISSIAQLLFRARAVLPRNYLPLRELRIFARRASCSIGNTVFPIEKNRPHQHSRVSEACSILSYKPLPVILPSGYSPEILFTSLIVSSYNDSRCSCKGYDQKCGPKCHIRCISRLWSCYTLFLLLGICRIVLCCLVILSVVAVVLLLRV